MTLAEWARRLDPQGRIDKIVEMMNTTNAILDDMIFVEGNLPTGHKTTIRTGLPEATWRLLNYGVSTGKSETKQVTDVCGMLETYSEVDKDLVKLSKDQAAFRLSEDRAFIEGMNQQMATTLFYGDTLTNPERFLGLSPRFAAYSADEDLIGSHVVKAGGSGTDNTSMWLVGWGENTVHGIFPQGSQAGLQHQDLGEVTLFDAAGGKYQGYRTHYKWDCGLCVRDWRYIARVCNIDVSALATAGTGSDSSAALELYMLDAMEMIPSEGLGNLVWYCNRTVRTALWKRLLSKSNTLLSLEDWKNGKRILSLMGIPIRRCDALLNSESLVS